MFFIHCPRTGRDELISDAKVRGLTNHPDHITVRLACPCGSVHSVRTGRRAAEATI